MPQKSKFYLWLVNFCITLVVAIVLICVFTYDVKDMHIIENSLENRSTTNALGEVGTIISEYLIRYLGFSVYPLLIVSFFSLVFFLVYGKVNYSSYVITLIFFTLSLCVLFSIEANFLKSFSTENGTYSGGIIGKKLFTLLMENMTKQVVKFIFIAILMTSCYFLYRLIKDSYIKSLADTVFREEDSSFSVEQEEKQKDLFEKELEKSNKEEIQETEEKDLNATYDQENFSIKNKTHPSGATNSPSVLKPSLAKVYKLPKVNLLSSSSSSKLDYRQETTQRYEALEQTLQDFNIKGKISTATRGPRVTLFEIIPEKGVPISSINKHSDNFALNMKASSVRISSLPTRGTIGVEVPNKSSESVGFAELLSSKEWKASKAEVPLCLGRDISNTPVIVDLVKAPHLLIAGATGAGKSVFMNTLILSLIFKFMPEDLNLVMIDPKFVEFAAYDKLPHLTCPVITEANKAPTVLRWATYEMDCRYQFLATTRSKNINAFNMRVLTKQSVREDKEGNPIPNKLPYLIVIIDELADLMMTAKKDIETSIARIAQKGRAAGVHLVVATQRPSVDVITGLIKANFPTRIAFQVSSAIDSRTILDSVGAEKLLGQGDMLFNPPGGFGVQRIQGAYVPDNDIVDVVECCAKQQEAKHIDIFTQYQEEQEDNLLSAKKDDKKDELFIQAVDLILRDKRVSTSHIQRKLGIGYNSAANIVDSLEENGYISAVLDGKGTREIYITTNPYISEDKDE